MVVSKFDTAVGTIPVLALRQLPADPGQRKQVEEINKFVGSKVADVRKMVEGGNPEDIAVVGAVAAAAEVFRLQASSAMAVSRRLATQLAQANAKLADYTRASRPGTPRDPVPTPAPAAELPIGASTQEAFAAWERSQA